MLVFNVAENLFHNVFQSHDAAGATKFVDHHAEALFALQKTLHELLCRHRFGHKGHGSDGLMPVVAGVFKHFGGVHIALYVVYILAVDNDFAVAAFHKLLHQFVLGAVHLHGINLGAWHHAVAHFGFRKFQCVLKNLHFVFNLFAFFGVADAGVHQIVEVNLGELFVAHFFFNADADDAE